MARKINDTDSKQAKQEAEAENRSNLNQPAFLDAVRKMAAMDEKAAAIRSARTALRKQFKANGIELGVMDAVMKMADWGRDEQRENFHRRSQYATWLGLAVGYQGELFAAMSDKERADAEWEAAGRTACYTGKPNQPPEDCPPVHHAAFMRGWNEADSQAWENSAPAPAEPAADKSSRPKRARTNAAPVSAADLPDIKKAAAKKSAAKAKAEAETPARDAVRDAVKKAAERKSLKKAIADTPDPGPGQTEAEAEAADAALH